MSVPDEWIRLACQGDRGAQEQIYRALFSRMQRVVMRIVGPSNVDDVLQDVFVNLFQKLRTFRFDASFSTWAHRLAVNDALQHLRRLRRTATVPLQDTGGAPEPFEQPCDLKEGFDLAFARLDADQQLLLELKEFEHLSYAEIARTLNIPEGTVGSRLNRARSDLRDRLTELGWE